MLDHNDKNSSQKNETAKELLALHYSSQKYFPEKCYRNVVNINGTYLGPYIPYIGKFYFATKPRILMYAMAQNLHKATHLFSGLLNDPKRSLYRQYQGTKVCVHPYDEGHLKIIAALALASFPNTKYSINDNIDDLICITNFVKFSFYKTKAIGKSFDANPPKNIYDTMWQLYCKYDVQILEPDLIIAVGNDVASALKRNLKADSKRIIIIDIPFPGRLNLNSRWIPKGKRLGLEGYNSDKDKAGLKALLQGTPDSQGKLKQAINTDWYYFREMKAHILKQMGQH
jgi:hypothetical protein